MKEQGLSLFGRKDPGVLLYCCSTVQSHHTHSLECLAYYAGSVR